MLKPPGIAFQPSGYRENEVGVFSIYSQCDYWYPLDRAFSQPG